MAGEEARLVQAAKALIPEGTKTLTVRYSGSGDEGSIDEIQIDGAYSRELSSLSWNSEFMNAVDPLIWRDVSPNNEGGGGELEIDFEAKTVTRSEYYNVQETEYIGEQVWKEGQE